MRTFPPVSGHRAIPGRSDPRCLLAAEPTLSLKDAAARKPPEFTPIYEDRAVVVTGQVSMAPIRLSNFFHLAIQEGGHGLVLEGSGAVFDRLSPGDWVEANGRISKRAGLPVVVVSKIATVSNGVRPAVVGMAKTLSREVGKHNITVNTILPGRILTDRLRSGIAARAQRTGKTVEQALEDSGTDVPFGRIGDPQEMANVIVFVGSEAGSYVNGTSIQVDGGLLRGLL